MVMQYDAENQIAGAGGCDEVTTLRQAGVLNAPVNSFDEFESLMAWLGYRQTAPQKTASEAH